jgi:hypothetical protein
MKVFVFNHFDSAGAKQAAEKVGGSGEIGGNIPQGLKRLRKKACLEAKCPKSIPQGLKPA